MLGSAKQQHRISRPRSCKNLIVQIRCAKILKLNRIAKKIKEINWICRLWYGIQHIIKTNVNDAVRLAIEPKPIYGNN